MTKFRWWWTWSSDDFESYLESMASRGNILESAGFGLMLLHFEKAAPQDIRYCVDYYNSYTEDYDVLVKDDGWQLMGSSSGWRLWAKPYIGNRPDLFTDKRSLMDRNNRLLKFLWIILMAQIPVAVINYSSILESTDGLLSPFGLTVAILYTFILVMLVFSMIKIVHQNKSLSK